MNFIPNMGEATATARPGPDRIILIDTIHDATRDGHVYTCTCGLVGDLSDMSSHMLANKPQPSEASGNEYREARRRDAKALQAEQEAKRAINIELRATAAAKKAAKAERKLLPVDEQLATWARVTKRGRR